MALANRVYTKSGWIPCGVASSRIRNLAVAFPNPQTIPASDCCESFAAVFRPSSLGARIRWYHIWYHSIVPSAQTVVNRPARSQYRRLTATEAPIYNEPTDTTPRSVSRTPANMGDRRQPSSLHRALFTMLHCIVVALCTALPLQAYRRRGTIVTAFPSLLW